MSIIVSAGKRGDEVRIIGPKAVKQWRDKHELYVPGYQHDPLFKRRRWNGKQKTGRLLARPNQQWELRCSRGLVPRILGDLDVPNNYDFTHITEKHIYAWRAQHRERFAKLRDYQSRAIDKILMAGWGRIAFATNAGKGAVISLLALYASDHNKCALVLCDELSVFDALQAELKLWTGAADIGLVKAGAKHPPTTRITLAMTQTLARRVNHDEWVDWLRGMDMVLVDEADKNGYQKILNHTRNTTWRGGFSGTFPDDLFRDLRLDESFGPILDRVKNKHLIKRGISARPHVHIYCYDATAYLGKLNRQWFKLDPAEKRRLVFGNAIMMNDDRHRFVRSLIRKDALTAVIVNRIEHGVNLARTIKGSVFLDGSTSAEQRRAALDAFDRGDLKTVIVTKILDRGSNRLGRATDIVLASGEGSTTQLLQRIGRGLRRTDGKAKIRIVDVVDVASASDAGEKIASGFLHKAIKQRLHTYASQEFKVSIHR